MLASHFNTISPQTRPAQNGFTRFSLFEDFEPQTIGGLSYYADYIGSDDEQALIQFSDKQVWNQDIRRRTLSFGRPYNSDAPSLPLPDLLKTLARRLRLDGIFRETPLRANINEYLPGQGIGAHRDVDYDYIQTIAIVSLGSSSMMDFSRLGLDDRSFYLQPKSLIIMQGEARTKWMHAIAPRKNDMIGGLIKPRDRRLSIVFRGA